MSSPLTQVKEIAVLSALKSELLRLLTLRSTLVYAILLTGSLYGPAVLVVLFNWVMALCPIPLPNSVNL